MTSKSKLPKYTLNNFSHILPYLLCTFVFFSFYLLHINKENKVYQENISQLNVMTYTVDQNLISTVDTLARLSASKSTLDFLELDTFDPITTLNAYTGLSKSFDVVSKFDTYIGAYNKTLNLVVSNSGTSTLEFFLEKYHFSNASSINDFISTPHEGSVSTAVFENDSHTYLLYLNKNQHLPNQPVFLALFNTDYIIKNLSPQGMTFDFDIVLTGEQLPYNQDISYTSKKLPIIYTFDLHEDAEQLATSRLVQTCLLGLSILSLAIAIYLTYRRFSFLRSLKEEKNAEAQSLLLKEVVYGIKKTNIKEALNISGTTLLDNRFLMIIISPQPEHTTSSSLTREHIDSYLNLFNIHLNFHSITITDHTFVIFCEDIDRNILYTELKPLATQLSTHYVLVTDYLELTAVSKKFYNLNQLLKNNTLLNRSNLILEESIAIKLPVSYTFSEQDQKLLLYYVGIQNAFEYNKLIDTLLTENLLTRRLDPEFHKQFLTVLCNVLNQISEELTDTKQLMEDLLQVSDLTQLKEQLIEVFQSYYDYLSQDQPKKDMQYRFLDYIHTHYQEDISLSDMAAEFNLAINYVGVLFKEKTSHNFKDYLNTYRISMAKELLAHSPYMKIKDLSIEVGFLNINTFIRIFKKYEGISPGQYQKYLLEQDSSKTNN